MGGPALSEIHDFIIVGAGISGSFLAQELCRAGGDCLMLEAGRSYTRETYPRTEVDGTSQLYWAGGLELSTDARTAFLRPKVVGGGSVVNQALVDRFDDVALDSWREVSGAEYFSVERMERWYEAAESEIAMEYIPAERRNKNALIFEEGFRKLGHTLAPLRRAQSGCRWEEGNDCIQCLSGCPIGSKQSTPETTLKRALASGLKLIPELEVDRIEERAGEVLVRGRDRAGRSREFQGRNLILAGGAIGNTRLLLASGFGPKLPALGQNFFCHPQYNNFALYDEPIRSHKGAFQAYKSDDPNFRRDGFKLENVFAPPAALALLMSGFGAAHHRIMESLDRLACIEVCTRDSNPGRISLRGGKKLVLKKDLGGPDRDKYQKGLKVVNQIFQVTGAKEIYNCPTAVGLHLMGGCCLGADPARSVVDPGFRLHGHKRILAADSSVFPNAPGINPSLTIMALAKKAAAMILGG